MKVLRSEGVAYHAGPESCVAGREASGEALAGVRVGWPLSRERWSVRGADAVVLAEGETPGSADGRLMSRRAPVDFAVGWLDRALTPAG